MSIKNNQKKDQNEKFLQEIQQQFEENFHLSCAEGHPTENDRMDSQPIILFIDWAKVSILEECTDPTNTLVMVIIKEGNGHVGTSIFPIDKGMTTNNWSIAPSIVGKG